MKFYNVYIWTKNTVVQFLLIFLNKYLHNIILVIIICLVCKTNRGKNWFSIKWFKWQQFQLYYNSLMFYDYLHKHLIMGKGRAVNNSIICIRIKET